MAKISYIRELFLLLFLVSSLSPLIAQENNKPAKKKVEITNADKMSSAGDYNRLIGNVALLHNEMYMTCDSAHYFENQNLVKAYSNVHIQKGDTLHIYGEYLIYDSFKETAEMFDSVLLIDKETKLYTDHIFYDITIEVAYYDTGGRILNKENILTSIIGKYFSETEVFHFKDSVKLVNPDYTMYADTLIYDTVTETAYFLGPSKVVGDSLYAHCKHGWYDTKNEKTLLLDSAMVDNKKQIVTGDSLYYENDNGYGTADFNVTISDLSKDIIAKGHHAWYYRDPERFLITREAQFIQVRENDSLFMHADTLWSVTESYTIKPDMGNDSLLLASELDSLKIFPEEIKKDSIVSYRLLRAYRGARIFSKDLQSKCDSLSYSFKDSVIRLYYEPVIWSDENQLTADSMLLFTENEEMKELKLYNNSFVIEEIDSSRYQQIKGKNLTAFFRDNSMYKIEVMGNGENIYFAIEEGELIGVNQSTCANMDIYLEEGKITDIYFLKNPEGSLDPPLHKSPSTRRLDKFLWLKYLRPLNKHDIFRENKMQSSEINSEKSSESAETAILLDKSETENMMQKKSRKKRD